MRFATTCLFLLLATGMILAQELSVSGTVTSPKGEPVSGALVRISGTDQSTYTDENGRFQIGVLDGYEMLVISAEGFGTSNVPLQGRTDVSVALKAGDAGSDDLLTVGFGRQSKKELTSSISQIDSRDVSPAPLINLEQSNQGMTTGLFVQNSSGKLGEATTTRVRGGSTLSNSNQPLYVVDGIPLVSANQSNINPSNIASIEILKDASAAAIYGSRAANGVIIITTKSGNEGKMQIDMDYQFGVSQTPRYLDLYSPEEYNRQVIEFTLRTLGKGDFITRENLVQWEQQLRGSGPNTISFSDGSSVTMPNFYNSLTHDTDWQREIFRTGLSHRSNLGLQGGNRQFGYFASLGYTTQEGILIGNKFNRLNGTVSLNSQITSRLSAKLNVNYIYTKDFRLNDDQDLGSPLQAIVLPPSDRYNPANNYNLEVRSLEYNPLTEINFSDNIGLNNSVIGNLGLTYDITDELALDVSGGIDFSDLRTERRQGPQTREGSQTGRSQLGETLLKNYIFNGYLTYAPELSDNHELSVVLGTSYQRSASEFSFRLANINSISQLESLERDSPILTERDIPNGANVFVSGFTRINYTLKERYILQFSGRVDGSSKFSPENRYGFFPAVSGGWIVSEEAFLRDVPVLSFLKLKGSYGLIGNVPLDDFLYRTNYFRVDYRTDPGLRLANLSNSGLKWETTSQLDVGFDVSVFDRVSISFDYYVKKTRDLLFPVPVSQTSGFGSVLRNVGEMENRGFEISLNTTNVQTRDFSWTTDLNISSNENTVTNLNGQNLIVGVNAFLEGQPAGVFYMRKYAGVNTVTGAPLYDNGNGGTTSDWESAPRMAVGNPNPRYFGGLINSLTFKNFELSFMFQFVMDVDLYWATGEFLANSGILNLSQHVSQVDRWYGPGDDDAANPVHNPFQDNTFPSTRWLQNGDYARLKNLTLTYNFPATTVAGWGLNYLSVYVGGTNLLTFSDYIGYDPDVNYVDPLDGVIGQNISRGIDNFTAPQPRIFMAGIKIGL